MIAGANVSPAIGDAGTAVDLHNEPETSTSATVSALNTTPESTAEPKPSKDQAAADAGKRNRELWDNDSKSYFFEALKMVKFFEKFSKPKL